MEKLTCSVLNREFPADEITSLSAIQPSIAALVRAEHAGLNDKSLISTAALAPYRAAYVHKVLEEDIGELTALEHDVVKSLREHEVLAANVSAGLDTNLTPGQRWADRIAAFGGSWRFIGCFGAFLAAWILANLVLGRGAPDPYPFILLNLLLSCLAALQAPVIMMSQNRQETKDRARGEHDYKVNLKAELEIRHLHEKMDFLLKQQSQRLFALQELQVELMEEISRSRAARPDAGKSTE